MCIHIYPIPKHLHEWVIEEFNSHKNTIIYKYISQRLFRDGYVLLANYPMMEF